MGQQSAQQAAQAVESKISHRWHPHRQITLQALHQQGHQGRTATGQPPGLAAQAHTGGAERSQKSQGPITQHIGPDIECAPILRPRRGQKTPGAQALIAPRSKRVQAGISHQSQIGPRQRPSHSAATPPQQTSPQRAFGAWHSPANGVEMGCGCRAGMETLKRLDHHQHHGQHQQQHRQFVEPAVPNMAVA